MNTPESAPPSSPFEGILGRNTGDCLLRTAQQHHVHLSAMADTKANIIITVSSIVLTLALSRLRDPDLALGLSILVAFTLLALLLAILAVLPKYRPLDVDSGALPPHFNIVFFGHFGGLDQQRFLEEIARPLRSDAGVYEAMAKDLYGLGSYLLKHKYRYLRWSYLFFLAGFVLASLEQGYRLIAK